MRLAYGAVLALCGAAVTSVFALPFVMGMTKHREDVPQLLRALPERIEARAETQPLVDPTCIFCLIATRHPSLTEDTKNRIVYEDEQVHALWKHRLSA